MSIIVRYFSTSSAGAGDGTSWANRAALFTGGAWSTVITGFAFNGSDSMEARVGPGTYSITVALASGSFANPPTVTNPLIIHGADSSGNLLSPPDPDWTSNMADWDASSLPILDTSSNINTLNLAACYPRLLKFTASNSTTAFLRASNC